MCLLSERGDINSNVGGKICQLKTSLYQLLETLRLPVYAIVFFMLCLNFTLESPPIFVSLERIFFSPGVIF